jgi:hypothetical protein
MFSGTNKTMASMRKVRQGSALLQWMLGRLAAAMRLDEPASFWTDRALEAAAVSKSPLLLMLLAPRAVSAALRRSAWADAIEAAITHGRAHVFLLSLRSEEASAIEDSVYFDPFAVPVARAAALEAEDYSLWLISRAVVNELGKRVVEATDEARAALNSFSDALKRFGVQLHLPAWQAMAESVSLSAALTMSDMQHSALLAESEETGLGNARFVAHGLLAFRADARLRQAVLSQVGVLRKLSAESESLGISAEVYAEAVNKFWENMSARAAFRFTTPREMIRSVKEAPAAPPMLRARVILLAAVLDQSANISDDARTWLSAS